MGVFAAAILVMLIVGVAAALSCGWGIAIAATLQVLLSCVYFALAAIFAIGMVMLSDYCHNAETIVIQVAPPGQLQGLVSFYINPNSDPSQASVEFQLATANLVNASQVHSCLFEAVELNLTPLNLKLACPSLSGSQPHQRPNQPDCKPATVLAAPHPDLLQGPGASAGSKPHIDHTVDRQRRRRGRLRLLRISAALGSPWPC